MGQLKYMKGSKDSKSHADIVAHIKDKYASLRRSGRLLGIRWNQLQRAGKFPYDTGDDIADFYIKPDVSINLPDRKFAGTRFLTRTLHAAHKE